VNLAYTVKRTSIVSSDLAGSTSPVISKEQVHLIIKEAKDYLLAVKVYDSELDNYHSSEAPEAGKSYRPGHLKFTPEILSIYDHERNLILEQSYESPDFSDYLTALRFHLGKGKGLSLNSIYLLPNVSRPGAGNGFRKNTTSNPYNDLPGYSVFSEAYGDPLDHRTYLQEIVVLDETGQVELVALYDDAQQLISKTSFRYESSPTGLELKNTHTTALEKGHDGSEVTVVTLEEFSEFSLNLNI